MPVLWIFLCPFTNFFFPLLLPTLSVIETANINQVTAVFLRTWDGAADSVNYKYIYPMPFHVSIHSNMHFTFVGEFSVVVVVCALSADRKRSE